MQRLLSTALLIAAASLRADAAPDANAWTNTASAETRPLVTSTMTVTATPTPGGPMTFKDSKAPVTPDPSFNAPGFSDRWPHITLAEAQRLHAMKGVVFADGRNHSEWEASHIPGAISLPVGEFDTRYEAAKKQLKKAKVIVTYCHGESCRLSDHLAQQLVGKGHTNVAVYAGGFPGWSGAGLPLEDKSGHLVKTPTPVVQATATPAPAAKYGAPHKTRRPRAQRSRPSSF
jgi:rhodanese-related sulfurtransferase